jgi:threonine synthase
MTSRLTHLECERCGREHDADVLQQRCACGGTLLARYDLADLSLAKLRERPSGMWRYRELLPVAEDPVSLGEPETPLLALARLSERWGVQVWLKDDGLMPGGTFKARGAAVGVSRARELGARRIVIPSAGNAGAAWALYAARAGIPITVVMSRSAPVAQRAEVEAAGAALELVDGSLADAGRRGREIADRERAFFAGTFFEPYRLEGKKSAWLELFDQMGGPEEMGLPRTVITPVGGGVAAVASAKAAQEVRALGWTEDAAPVLIGVQAADCAPITEAFEAGRSDVPPWPRSTSTIAAGLRVPAPAEGPLVLETVRASGGSMASVSEEEIRAAIGDLAAGEGVFACPEGAATLAAGEALAAAGRLEGPVVLYNTGSGIKYIDVL